MFSGDFSPQATAPNAAPTLSAEAYHFADITPGQAELLNDSVTIKLFGFTHGSFEDRMRNADQVDIEYAQAAGVVESLDASRGDVLFTELSGHEGEALDWSFVHASYTDHADKLAALEVARQNRVLTPSDYALELARLKGVPIVVADMHKEVQQQYINIVDDAPDIALEGNSLEQIYHQLRVEQAAHTVKDYALDHAPWALPTKPTYAVLWGKAHMIGPEEYGAVTQHGTMQDAFTRMGLQSHVEILQDAGRFRLLARVAWQLRTLPLAGNAPEQLRQTPEEFPGFPKDYLHMADPARPGYRAGYGRKVVPLHPLPANPVK